MWGIFCHITAEITGQEEENEMKHMVNWVKGIADMLWCFAMYL